MSCSKPTTDIYSIPGHRENRMTLPQPYILSLKAYSEHYRFLRLPLPECEQSLMCEWSLNNNPCGIAQAKLREQKKCAAFRLNKATTREGPTSDEETSSQCDVPRRRRYTAYQRYTDRFQSGRWRTWRLAAALSRDLRSANRWRPGRHVR